MYMYITRGQITEEQNTRGQITEGQNFGGQNNITEGKITVQITGQVRK
jgi:hypothetical protein